VTALVIRKDVNIFWENQKLVVKVDEQTLRRAETRERPRQPSASPR